MVCTPRAHSSSWGTINVRKRVSWEGYASLPFNHDLDPSQGLQSCYVLKLKMEMAMTHFLSRIVWPCEFSLLRTPLRVISFHPPISCWFNWFYCAFVKDNDDALVTFFFQVMETLLPEASKWSNSSAWANQNAWFARVLRKSESGSTKGYKIRKHSFFVGTNIMAQWTTIQDPSSLNLISAVEECTSWSEADHCSLSLSFFSAVWGQLYRPTLQVVVKLIIM